MYSLVVISCIKLNFYQKVGICYPGNNNRLLVGLNYMHGLGTDVSICNLPGYVGIGGLQLLGQTKNFGFDYIGNKIC